MRKKFIGISGKQTKEKEQKKRREKNNMNMKGVAKSLPE